MDDERSLAKREACLEDCDVRKVGNWVQGPYQVKNDGLAPAATAALLGGLPGVLM